MSVGIKCEKCTATFDSPKHRFCPLCHNSKKDYQYIKEDLFKAIRNFKDTQSRESYYNMLVELQSTINVQLDINKTDASLKEFKQIYKDY